jgi:altronate dehydratase
MNAYHCERIGYLADRSSMGMDDQITMIKTVVSSGNVIAEISLRFLKQHGIILAVDDIIMIKHKARNVVKRQQSSNYNKTENV